MPTSEGFTLLIDAGANTDVKPINLAQFAVMGSVYSRRVRNIARPRVGILSNGEEASKGTEITRAAAAMLEQMATYVNYIGYVEGRDINRGKADVVVTDGFTGNVALKTMEGFSAFLLGILREVFGGSWRSGSRTCWCARSSPRCASGSIRQNSAARRCSASTASRSSRTDRRTPRRFAMRFALPRTSPGASG